MVVLEDEATRHAELFSCCPLSFPSQVTGTSCERVDERLGLFKQDVNQHTEKVIPSERNDLTFSHSLHHVQDFSCDSPVQFMLYCETTASFISLHLNGTISLYKANGRKKTVSRHFSFLGLTATGIPGCLVGWGPGPVCTLLDCDLNPLYVAEDALDIRVCEAAEHSSELVTAGFENVCVWSMMLMRCKIKIQEGLLQNSTFTLMTLVPPQPDQPHRAFVVCGQVLTVVNLDGGKVLEHKKNLCTSDITAMAYCFTLDCLIIASQELSVKIWGPDWEPRGALSGHTDIVNSLFFSAELDMMVSSSADGTIRCWSVEECAMVHCVKTEETPLYIGGTRNGDTLFSFSKHRVDLWAIRILYTCHCQLSTDEEAPVRQILVSSCPDPYPTRVLCICGDNNITLVAAQTGAVLTSFKAWDKIVCADYCLQKEILLALTEGGTVLKASTLTNPISLVQEWKGRGQDPWDDVGHMTENEIQNLPAPGPACCLALYSSITEPQRALDEWRGLQAARGSSGTKNRGLDDPKNKFLIIIGQTGGCVSVLKMNNGKVLYRTQAHNFQKVTSVQVFPEDKYLITAGEDMTVIIWRVYPSVRECLIQQMILQIDQPQAYLTVLCHQLALTFEDPYSNTYNLKFFNLLKKNQEADHPWEGHSDRFTGLCVIPELKLFISSSLDKTVNIWNEENQLIGILELHIVPQCIAYSGFGGELLLGIDGDLYRIKLGSFLPRDYKKMIQSIYEAATEFSLDSPIPQNKESFPEKTTKDEEEMLQTITSNQLLHRFYEMYQQQQNTLVTLNMDLDALLQGTVKCRKGKPPSTDQTKKEAFGRYMTIIHKYPLNTEVSFDRALTPRKFSIYAKTKHIRPLAQPKTVKEEAAPIEGEKKRRAPVILKKDVPQVIEQVEDEKPIIVTPPKPPEIIKKPQLKPLLREQIHELPDFFKQFADMEWFLILYPNKKNIPEDLTPDDFIMDLLNFLPTCKNKFKNPVFGAMKLLHNQGLVKNKDKLYANILAALQKFAKPNMTPVERVIIAEMLELLMNLKAEVTYEFMKKLLTLVSYKELKAWKMGLNMLTLLGVSEARKWLWPEIRKWASELDDHPHSWEIFYSRADHWLESWASKFKIHNRYQCLGKSSQGEPSTSSVVDVLNYFCSIRKQEQSREAFLGTVYLPPDDCSDKPIHRLGETYGMTRTRKPTGFILPPRYNRPSLMHFPNFITLPLPQISPSLFDTYSDKDRLKASAPRYFIQQQSRVEYYRW